MNDPRERYWQLIEATTRAALAAPRPLQQSVGNTIEMASILPVVAHGLTAVETPLINSSAAQPLDAESFVDGAGHRRPMYRGLAMRWLRRSGRRAPESLAVGQTLKKFVNDAGSITAAAAPDVLQALGDAHALPATPLARATVTRVVNAQQQNGTFFASDAHDNPEPLWYAELIALHIVHVHAVEAADDRALAAAARSAAYLAAEVQPDHASSQPWAIAALLDAGGDGIMLADAMLHAAGVQEPATMDAVSVLLLADAWQIDCGRRSKTG